MVIHQTGELVWGVVEPKPIIGAPDGKQRLRIRNKDAARLFIKTPHTIRCFLLQDMGTHWKPCAEQASNYRSAQLNGG